MVVCKNCGRQGHVSVVCPYKKPPEQIHAIVTEPGNVSVSSGEDNVLILAQVDDNFVSSTTTTTPVSQRPPTQEGFFFTQDTAAPTCRPISSDLLLLDSQSTVHLFSQPEHVNNIRPAATPIRVHCNKGTLETTQEANFGHTPVYFDARGIANFLSLYQLGQKFKVTYDGTDCGGVFKVFTSEGVVEFTPTSKGLHAINLRDNPEAAFLLVNDADFTFGDSPVKTVRNNYERFTKKQVHQANLACGIMGMIDTPTEREYQALVRLNLLQDCPITNSDIVNAHKIFDPDLANIRGKTVCRCPEHVNTEIVNIP